MHLPLVFHVSLLEPWTSSSIPNWVIPPPPPVLLAEGPKYEVEAILDSKIISNKLYNLVDWLGTGLTIERGNLQRTLLMFYHPMKQLEEKDEGLLGLSEML